MIKSPQSQQGKEKSGFWLLNQNSIIESVLLSLLFLLLPTQLGKHFWPDFSLVHGIRVDYLSPTVYVTDIVIGLLFVSWFIHHLTKSPKLFKKTYILALFVVLFFIQNIFFSERVELSIYYFFKLLEFCFLGFYLANVIRSAAQFTNISILFAISSFFESLLTVLQFFKQGSLDGWLYYLGERTFDGSTPGIANASINGDLLLRPYGTFSHPNVLAGYLLFSIIFMWYFLITKTKGFVRAFGMFVFLLASCALLLTLSRIVIVLWLLFVLMLIVLLLISKSKVYKKRFIGIVLLVASLVIVSLPFSQTLFTRFAETSFGEEAIIQREELINSAVTLIHQHPLSGAGIGNFIPALAPLQSPLSLGLYLQPVHNMYLLVAAEIGLLGFCLFLIFLLLTVRRIVKQDRRIKIPLLLLLSGILVISLVDHYWVTLQQGQLLFTVLLGFSWVNLETDIISA